MHTYTHVHTHIIDSYFNINFIMHNEFEPFEGEYFSILVINVNNEIHLVLTSPAVNFITYDRVMYKIFF